MAATASSIGVKTPSAMANSVRPHAMHFRRCDVIGRSIIHTAVSLIEFRERLRSGWFYP